MSDSLLALFCHGEDFCQLFLPRWQHHLLAQGILHRQRQPHLCLSEVRTILIAFPTSPYRDGKAFPPCEVQGHCFGPCTGTPFVDATTPAVCHNRRIAQHRVFAGLAARGKTSLGWFFGFKLHLLVKDKGELLKVALPPGNTADRKPVPRLTRRLFGRLFADKGSLSAALTRELW